MRVCQRRAGRQLAARRNNTEPAEHRIVDPMEDASDVPNDRRNIVVIGASAGGVGALQRLAADLPPLFPAVVLIVLHVGANRSLLPRLLAAAGPNPPGSCTRRRKTPDGAFDRGAPGSPSAG
jgi:chemotaxis response regulator CheB